MPGEMFSFPSAAFRPPGDAAGRASQGSVRHVGEIPGIDFFQVITANRSFLASRKAISRSRWNAGLGSTGRVTGTGKRWPLLEPHLLEHTLVVGMAHKAVEGGEGPSGQQFEVTHGAGGSWSEGS